MHIPDVDYNTNYISFKSVLKNVKEFSDKNSNHIPIFIMLEMKEESIAYFLPGLGFAETLPWNSSAFDVLEKEILSIFSEDDIIKLTILEKMQPLLLMKGYFNTVGLQLAIIEEK